VSSQLIDPASVVIERRVQWPDTDAAGHQHHSVVMRWVEEAELALLDGLGLAHLFGRTPRVNYQADYRARLWLGQRVVITLAVAQIGTSSLTYHFDVGSGETSVASGEVSIVHTGTNATGAQPWPAKIRAALSDSGVQRRNDGEKSDIPTGADQHTIPAQDRG